ncbi:MAG: hypothetical protein WCX71_03000 [Candidatus Buchananbacteria bacterium]
MSTSPTTVLGFAFLLAVIRGCSQQKRAKLSTALAKQKYAIYIKK